MDLEKFFSSKRVSIKKNEISKNNLSKLEKFLKNKKFKDFNLNALQNLLKFDNVNYDLNNRLSEIKNLGKDSSSLESFILRYGKKKGTEFKKQKDLKSKPKTKDELRKEGLSEAEIKSLLKTLRSSSRSQMILKHGKEKGIDLYNKKINKWKKSNTLEGFIELYGEKEGNKKWDLRNKKHKGKGTLKWYISKYGNDLGKKLYSERNNKISIFQKNSKQNKNTVSLNSFIKRYGDENGKKEYKKYCLKQSKISKDRNFGLINPGYSKIASNLFNEIINNIDIKEKFYYQPYSNEYSCETGKYNYDFVVPKTKKVIEFNGDKWHANPELYEENDKPNPFNELTSKDIWNYDKNKIKAAEEKGYKVLIIWEKDLKENYKNILQRCISFLKN